MPLIILNFLFFLFVTPKPSSYVVHPIYVSTTDIRHNAKAKTLEISCRIFTDDFEKTLRQKNKSRIDLLKPGKDKTEMEEIVRDYITRHLKIQVDGKDLELSFIGYEQDEEAIMSYFEVAAVSKVKTIRITDNILYDYKQGQVSLIHVTVNGSRKSTRLNNPDDIVTFNF